MNVTVNLIFLLIGALFRLVNYSLKVAVFSAPVQMLNLLLAFEASTVSGLVPRQEGVTASVADDRLSGGDSVLVGSVSLLAQACRSPVFRQIFASF